MILMRNSGVCFENYGKILPLGLTKSFGTCYILIKNVKNNTRNPVRIQQKL